MRKLAIFLIFNLWLCTATGTSLLSDIFSVSLVFDPCARLLNSTGVVGCQSSGKPSGVLYKITNSGELYAFLSLSSSQNFVPVLSFSMFSPATISAVNGAKVNVAGVVVLQFSGVNVGAFSPATSCPNCFGITSTSYVWNPLGNGLSMQSFNFPIYTFAPRNSMANDSLSQIEQAISYNSAQGYDRYPLYGLQFNALMFAAGNSQQCLNPTFDTVGNTRCDPIGGQSVYASFAFNRSRSSAKGTIAVTSALDATSFFHPLAVGAESSVAATVTQLALMESLSRNPSPAKDFSRDILFTMFQAESWNFAGSSRFARDLSTFQCGSANTGQSSGGCGFGSGCLDPCRADVNFTRFAAGTLNVVVALDQILGTGLNFSFTPINLYAHEMPSSSSGAAVQSFIDAVANVPANVSSADFEISAANASQIPPNSGIALVNIDPDHIEGVILSDYNEAYTTPFFGSDLDNGDSWGEDNVQLLCGLSQVALEAVYNLANNYPSSHGAPPVSINCSLVRELMVCFTRNNSCPLFTSFLTSSYNLALATAQVETSHYAGVYSFYPNLFSEFARNFAAYYTRPRDSLVYNVSNGDWVPDGIACVAQTDCDNLIAYQAAPEASTPATPLGMTCINAACVASLSSYHGAFSLGLELNENTGLFTVADASIPIWTESRYVFLKKINFSALYPCKVLKFI